MNISKTSFACFAFAMALSACDEGKGPGNPDAYQGKDGVTGSECTQAFLNEYNEVALTAQHVESDFRLTDTTSNRAQMKSDAQSLKTKATALKSKYAGVVCLAKNEKTGEKTSLDVDQRMKKAIEAADAALSIANAPASEGNTSRVNPPASSTAPQCSASFIDEYLAVNDYAKTVADDLEATPANHDRTIRDAQTLKEKAKAFQMLHAGYKCDVGTGSTRYTIDVDASMKDLVTTADKVIELLNGGASPAQASRAFTKTPAVEPMELL